MPRAKRTLFAKVTRLMRARLFRAGGYGFGAISILAVVVGAIAGYAAIGMYLVISWLLKFTFGVDGETLATGASNLDWWHLLFVPTVGGLVVGQLLRLHKKRQSSGVAAVIEASALRDSKIDLKDGLVSATITAVSLGSGASMGREGPAVHLGATLAAVVTNFFKLNHYRLMPVELSAGV